jgi:hypothetical protein
MTDKYKEFTVELISKFARRKLNGLSASLVEDLTVNLKDDKIFPA